MKRVYTYQPGRFGDIFYTIPIARRLKEKGYDVSFMIREKYKSLIPHFPDINFVECNNEKPVPTENCIFLSLWYGIGWKKSKGVYNRSDLMTCKYEMYNECFKDNVDPNTYWHSLTFKRFPKKEKQLMEKLGIKTGEKYVFINELYSGGKTEISVNTDLKKIYMKLIDGFTILDWCSILENAEEIHCVDTSILYIIDRIKTTNKLHRYRRHKEDVELRHLLSKDYIKHDVNGNVEDYKK